jgi:hypothetical protein
MSTANSTYEPLPKLKYRIWPALTKFITAILYLVLAGCSTWQVPAEFDYSDLRFRAESQNVKGVELSATVLSTDDSQRIFGVDVNGNGVQPVWLEVKNNTKQVLWLLRSSTDPDLFSPLEVAWSFHANFAGETNDSIDQHFSSMSFQSTIVPGATKSGMIFTNPHDKTRLLSIDMLGQGEIFPFTLFLTVPDDADGSAIVWRLKVIQSIEAVTYDYQDVNEFRTRLEQLPCCARSVDGNEAGDPLNVIMVGHIIDIATSLARRGFRVNLQDLDNAQWLLGRPPDIVARKAGQGGVPTNWVRMWVAPFRFQGLPVFLVQTGRRQGWRLAEVEEEDMVLNPYVDEVRNFLIQDMVYSSGLQKIAFVSGVGATEPNESRDSLGGGNYQTDGLRTVLFFVTRPQFLSDIEILNWHSYLKLREIEAVKEIENVGD